MRIRKKWNVDIVINPPEFAFITKRKFDCSADNLSMKIRKELGGARLIEVNQVNFDRIIQFKFNKAEVTIELFSHGNIILTRDGITLSALRYENWKDREIRPKRKYAPPKPTVNPYDINLEEFTSIFTEDNIMRSMVKHLKLGKDYIEKLISESGENKNSAKPKNIQRMFNKMKEILEVLSPGIDTKPVVMPITDNFKPMKSFNDALDEFYGNKLVKNKVNPKLEKRLDEQLKALSEMKKKAVEYKEIGDKIYEHMQDLKEILDKIKKMRKNGKEWREIEKELNVKIDEKSGKMWVDLV